MNNNGSNDEQLWEEHDYDGRGRPRPSAQMCANCGAECGNEGHDEDNAMLCNCVRSVTVSAYTELSCLNVMRFDEIVITHVVC